MTVLGLYCSPRKGGNSDILLDDMLRGAEDAGATVKRVYVRDIKVAPCLGCAACDRTGTCVIRDEFDQVIDEIDTADALILSTPIHFYTVSTQAMSIIGRTQALWARRYVIKDEKYVGKPFKPGALIAVGATNGSKLFDGIKLTAYYFLNAAGFSLDHELLVPGVDHKAEILDHPEYIKKAYEMGKAIAAADEG